MRNLAPWYDSKLTILSMLSGVMFSYCLSSSYASADTLSGSEVVKQCYYKYRGKDQRIDIDFTMTNKDGEILKKRKFIRLWKDYQGQDDILSKMMWYTISPSTYRDNNLLRLDYTLESGKPPEQWVYMSKTHTIRRLTVRDPEQALLNWGMIAEDFHIRQLHEDTHDLLETIQKDDRTFYKIRSTPRKDSSQYGELISLYEKKDEWDNCFLRSTEYYGLFGEKIKKANFKWQQVEKAWLPNTVEIVFDKIKEKLFEKKNKPEKVFVTYKVSNVKIDIGLKDKDFSKRMLGKVMK